MRRTLGMFGRSLVREESGAILPVAVLCLTVILGMGALAIDVTRGFVARDQLQASADAAALAGASLVFDQTASRAAALQYGNLNAPTGAGTVISAADVVFGTWNSGTRTFTAGGANPNAVQTTTRMTGAQGNAVPTVIASALGFNSFDVTATAIATGDNGAQWDVVLVQDVTGSFRAELPDAVTADQTLLSCINNRARPQSLIGGVAFTGEGLHLQQLDELQNGFNAIYNSFGNLRSCDRPGMPRCSGTHIGAGMQYALDQYTTYDTANGPPAPGGPPRKRAMIIVSDGEPNCRRPVCGSSTQDLRNQAVARANDADAAGISVFTVLYNQGHSQGASNFLSSLTRGEGTFHETPDPTRLTDLLETICNAQLPLRLVQ